MFQGICYFLSIMALIQICKCDQCYFSCAPSRMRKENILQYKWNVRSNWKYRRKNNEIVYMWKVHVPRNNNLKKNAFLWSLLYCWIYWIVKSETNKRYHFSLLINSTRLTCVIFGVIFIFLITGSHCILLLILFSSIYLWVMNSISLSKSDFQYQ